MEMVRLTVEYVSMAVQCRMLKPSEVAFVSCSVTRPLCGTFFIMLVSQLLPHVSLLYIIQSLFITR